MQEQIRGQCLLLHVNNLTGSQTTDNTLNSQAVSPQKQEQALQFSPVPLDTVSDTSLKDNAAVSGQRAGCLCLACSQLCIFGIAKPCLIHHGHIV